MKPGNLEGLNRILVKYFQHRKYLQYKHVMSELKNRAVRAAEQLQITQTSPDVIFRQRTTLIQHPQMLLPQKEITSFSHSGNCGDIIYAFASILKLTGSGKAEILLEIGRPFTYQNFHPLGNVMLNTKMAEMLIPLLTYQPSVSLCKISNGEPVDYKLDLFREYSFYLDRGSIARWYFYVFGISAALHEPWLIVPENKEAANAIVIARSHRYHAPLIDYSFLSEYPHLIFIGVEEEYRKMKAILPSLVWRPVADFLEMAAIINGCRLFIGNQSFPYSLAEALKVNRLLEVFYEIPNVIPEGPGANEFLYQPQFEASVAKLFKQPFS